MRAFVQRPLAFIIFGLAVALPRWVHAQPAEVPEEITVQGGRTLREYRLELERARDEIFRRFNEANQGTRTDVTCKNEQPTGSRTRRNVCRTAAENQADAAAAYDFLGALVRSTGTYGNGTPNAPPGTLVAANIGTAGVQVDGQSGKADALAKFEQEWKRLLREDRDFHQAVVQYVELENQYNSVRGVNDPAAPSLAGLDAAATAARPSGPQCEATTLTEYFQRNDLARVSGRISLSACPAGTTGIFTLVARVRDDDGEIRPLEFEETWQRDDTEDHTFNVDYPLGGDVELMNVRVRNLKCTCAEPAQ